MNSLGCPQPLPRPKGHSNEMLCCKYWYFVCTASKGFWSEMLGVGDFYYELGIQIIEVCLATSHRNGG